MEDFRTAQAFASSWNNLPDGSVYTYEQFLDWIKPLTKADISKKTVLEFGCGNGSLMCHLVRWNPRFVKGVDLGDSVISCRKNMELTLFENFEIDQTDLVCFRSNGYDFVYCIGVLHHLKNPFRGFESVIKNTKPGGKFHCWVYAKEGNELVRLLVEPIRMIASKLPWWFNKYIIVIPLAFAYFLYANLIVGFKLSKLPLYDYSKWITERDFDFFRHVVFDQLVTPQTTYIDKKTIESWFDSFPDIDHDSKYLIFRNGNSWKFGGQKLCSSEH